MDVLTMIGGHAHGTRIRLKPGVDYFRVTRPLGAERYRDDAPMGSVVVTAEHYERRLFRSYPPFLGAGPVYEREFLALVGLDPSEADALAWAMVQSGG